MKTLRKENISTGITALGLLAICILLAACRSESSPESLPESGKTTEQETTAVSFISVAELKDKLESGSPIILVDIRNSDAYSASHIDRAVSIPLDEIPDRYQEIPQDREVIVYSGCA